MNLTVDVSEVHTFNNATEIELSCEMSLYLRPDEDLQWFKNGELIVSGNNRYTITYTNGNRNLGQFGGESIGLTRVSRLVVSEPQLSDSGVYTCNIRDTNQWQSISLIVQES